MGGPGEAEHERVERLAAQGWTVDIGDLDRGDQVIQVDAFGGELWKVEGRLVPRPKEGRIEGARLILENGNRVTDRSRLSFLDRKIEKFVYAV